MRVDGGIPHQPRKEYMEKVRKFAVFVILCIILTRADNPSLAAPKTVSHVGLVVRFGNGNYIVRCIPFEEASITGMEVLRRSGLDIATAEGAVCRIETDGCPSDDCFCQCRPGAPICLYWSYWHLLGDHWQYSGVGAEEYQVHDDDIEGWVWGSTGAPPEVALADICNAHRISPGVPTVGTTCTAIEIYQPYQGDENQNGVAHARARPVGGNWLAERITLARGRGLLTGRIEGLLMEDYEVEIEITDPDGVNGSPIWVLTTTVGIVADFVYSPSNPRISETVTFTDTSRGLEPVSRVWDLGDGTTVFNETRVNHVYSTPGTYTVTLTLDGVCGISSHSSTLILSAYRIYLPQLLGRNGA